MTQETKEQYVSPRSEELEIDLEGVIALSDPHTGGGIDP